MGRFPDYLNIQEDIKLSLDDVLLVPKYSEVGSRLSTDISTTLVGDIKLDIPVVSAAMDTISGREMAVELGRLGGAAFLHRFAYDDEILDMVRYIKEHGQLAIPSLGIRGDIINWCGLLLENGADALSIDIAHGDSKHVMDIIGLIKNVFPTSLVIAGNVATGGGTRRLIEAGADAVKSGVGPGAVCKTRIVTGYGIATFSALTDCVDIARRYDIPVIADGGLKHPGDYTKCLALGASSCMTGSMLAGTKETPGKEIKVGNEYFKSYRGMASYEAQKDFKGGMKDGTATEGEAVLVPLAGPVKEKIDYICGGIRSGLTYNGANNLEELKEGAEFIIVSNSAIVEGTPHKLKG